MTTQTALPAARSSLFGLPLICLLLTLAGCAGQGPYHEPDEPEWEPSRKPPAVQTPAPQNRPMPPVQPQPPKQAPRLKAHPRFAPPPGGNCYWDTGLGVYVLEGQRNVFYRERIYYRWDNGWSYSNSPQGPWQPTDSSGVPAGLGRHFR